jgi:endonuclease/exonuclease/phosphatase family metal-dependent hydrolase
LEVPATPTGEQIKLSKHRIGVKPTLLGGREPLRTGHLQGGDVRRRYGIVAVWAVLAPLTTAVGVEAQSTIRVASYNIKHGLGMDGVIDLNRVADVLRGLEADVITLQEVDNGVRRSGGVDQAGRLGELLEMRAIHGAFRPYQGGEYGMAILTRLPVRGVRNHAIPPGPEGALSVLEVRVSAGPGAPDLSVVGIHFYRTPEERLAQADSVTRIFGDAERPVILAGDFNSRPGSLVLDRLMEDWRPIPKEGARFTFPAEGPDREIDHVFVRPADLFEVVSSQVVDERVASDHRPVVVELRIW